MITTKPIYLIAPTPTGLSLAEQLLPALDGAVLWSGVTSELASAWQTGRQLVFFLTVGATVRLIAPLLDHKASDPGVVVVDEGGTFAVSLSGGHRGGADVLTEQIAALLGATAVITSASRHKRLPPVDLLGKPYGWVPGADSEWNRVAAAVVRGLPVQVVQTSGQTLWRTALPEEHPFVFDETDAEVRLWISERLPSTDVPTVCWHPRVLWLGVGCERGTPAPVLEQAVRSVLTDNGLAIEAVAGIATVTLKHDEAGLLALAQKFDWPLRFFEPAILAGQPVPHPSATVENCIGTPSVAEAAAMLAGDTSTLRVVKQIFRVEGAGACTVAVAVAEVEYNPNPGALILVGTGPGALDQITPAARAAIVRADVVIGYALYIDLLRPLLSGTQVIEASPITQEVARAERAITLSYRGLQVVVVSSGDSGIYGMAGLVLERLAARGWDGERPTLTVLPGITALQAAAARVGAPLMHDFCAISLSDLLTPWPLIERRLAAAAQADFVVALYNPRSLKRTAQIEQARHILLSHRDATTPVALVRSAYRPDECVTLTTLAEFASEQVDMLTTVLIGNSTTFRHGPLLITPRGYPATVQDVEDIPGGVANQ